MRPSDVWKPITAGTLISRSSSHAIAKPPCSAAVNVNRLAIWPLSPLRHHQSHRKPLPHPVSPLLPIPGTSPFCRESELPPLEILESHPELGCMKVGIPGHFINACAIMDTMDTQRGPKTLPA